VTGVQTCALPILHYAVANIPGAVARTSTMSLTNNTSQYGVFLANKGLVKAVKTNAAFAKGVNTHDGAVTNQPVAETHDMRYETLESVLEGKPVSLLFRIN